MSLDSNIVLNNNLGKYGEDRIAMWLEDQGFTVLERNFKQRYGEIDLIAKKKDLLVFVEVKTRKKQYFNLSTVIIPSKQHKIIKTAHFYLHSHQIHKTIIRFDVALVSADTDSITYIPNAFTESEYETQTQGISS